MVNKIRACVFISGNGSNLKSIIKSSRDYNFPIKIELIITNNIKAKGLYFAKKYSGCTVHFVSPKLDSGKIILQKKILIDKNETESSLKIKILKQEHKLYPQSIISVFR